MKLLVTFRQPGRGFYKMYMSSKEVIRFINGKARREPASNDAITNSVPIKYITSIRIVGTEEMVCSGCKKPKQKLLCFDCITAIAQSTETPA